MNSGRLPTLIKKFSGGQANMGSVGAALAPKGIKPMDFINMFNKHPMCAKYPGVPLTVEITLDKKNISIKVRAPDNAHMIREALKLKQGSKMPGRDSVGQITWSQILNIAKVRHEEDSSTGIFGWCKTVSSSAKSAGIETVGTIEELEALCASEGVTK